MAVWWNLWVGNWGFGPLTQSRQRTRSHTGLKRQCWPIVMFFNLPDDCMATDKWQLIGMVGNPKKKIKREFFVTLWNYTMWIYIKRSLLFVDITGKMIWLIKSLVMFAHFWLWLKQCTRLHCSLDTRRSKTNNKFKKVHSRCVQPHSRSMWALPISWTNNRDNTGVPCVKSLNCQLWPKCLPMWGTFSDL